MSFAPFIYYGDGPRVEVSTDDAGNVYAAPALAGNGIFADIGAPFPVGNVADIEGGEDDPRATACALVDAWTGSSTCATACALVDAWARREGWDIYIRHGGAMDVLGYYIGEGMAGPACPDCMADYGYDPESPDSHPIFGDSEADTPTHCEGCESLLAHDLTPDGIEYVRERIEEGTGRPGILAAWRDAYGYALEREGVTS